MKVFNWTELNEKQRVSALARPAAITNGALVTSVKDIMANVKTRGNAALRSYTSKFDGVKVASLTVKPDLMKAAWDTLPADQKRALKTAKANIEAFHEAQTPSTIEVETMPGVVCRRIPRSIETVGLYVPGGTAPLVSTLLMLAIPAKIAGCQRRVVITPPGKDGQVNQAVLAAAFLCDVTDLFISGGAQAIAALAYGTETIPKCDKIFGPGNAYVAMAKSLVSQEPGGPAIDLPAGPSEAMVVADKSSNPVFVAADFLSQAEHDTMAQVICVVDNADTATSILSEIDKQITTLPRKEIAEKSITSSRIFIADTQASMTDVINSYAPEHLIIQAANADSWVNGVKSAGSIFLGPWTPESVGDYASGTNHTLPTSGAAKAYSGVTLESYFTFISVQKLTQQGLRDLGPTVETLANMEGLEAHRRAVSLRLESNQDA